MKRALLLISFSLLFGFLFAASNHAQSSGRVFWRGMVDNRVHLIVNGSTLTSRTIAGTTTPEGVYSFTAPLPRAAVKVGVLKVKGRSKLVRVIEQPSEQNDFTAIVEIYDDGSGAKEYQIEIFW
ncbi:MAG: hypothetical protein ACT4O9_00805 [Blastocatellia bacterium]